MNTPPCDDVRHFLRGVWTMTGGVGSCGSCTQLHTAAHHTATTCQKHVHDRPTPHPHPAPHTHVVRWTGRIRKRQRYKKQDRNKIIRIIIIRRRRMKNLPELFSFSLLSTLFIISPLTAPTRSCCPGTGSVPKFPFVFEQKKTTEKQRGTEIIKREEKRGEKRRGEERPCSAPAQEAA